MSPKRMIELISSHIEQKLEHNDQTEKKPDIANLKDLIGDAVRQIFD